MALLGRRECKGYKVSKEYKAFKEYKAQLEPLVCRVVLV